MKTKTYFFRLIIALIALVIGLGVYRIVERFQHSFDEHDACLNQPQNSIPIAAKEEPVETASTQEDSEFYPDGEFYLDDKLPKEFKDFNTLSITSHDWTNATEENNYQPETVIPKGYLKTGKKYNFTKISIANRRISFETGRIKGISYSFIGKYPEIKEFDEDWTDLHGTLTKYKDGKKIAQIKLKLLALDDEC
jgi:hypothetical protein